MPEHLNRIGKDVRDAVLRVHRELGPGLLERAYQVCLVETLIGRGRTVRTEVAVPSTFEDREVDAGFRLDIVVDDAVIIELKAVEELHPVHEAQLLTYLRLSGHRIGDLVNFNTVRVMDGLRRYVL